MTLCPGDAVTLAPPPDVAQGVQWLCVGGWLRPGVVGTVAEVRGERCRVLQRGVVREGADEGEWCDKEALTWAAWGLQLASQRIFSLARTLPSRDPSIDNIAICDHCLHDISEQCCE